MRPRDMTMIEVEISKSRGKDTRVVSTPKMHKTGRDPKFLIRLRMLRYSLALSIPFY